MAPQRAVIVGALVLDVQAQSDGVELQRGGSVPGRVKQVPGGVGRNIAEAVAALCPPEQRPVMISVVADDPAGSTLLAACSKQGIDTSGVSICKGMTTPTVSIIFDTSGEVAACVADVKLLEQEMTSAVLQRQQHLIRSAAMLVMDGNMSPAALQTACSIAVQAGVPVFFEPVSAPKAVRCAEALSSMHFISPNANELVAIAGRLRQLRQLPQLPVPSQEQQQSATGALQHLQPHIQEVLQAGVRRVVLTLGEHGAALLRLEGSRVAALLLPAIPAKVCSVSGAGDTLVAGMIAALLRGTREELALAVGVAASKHAVESATNVPPGLQYEKLLATAQQHVRSSSQIMLTSSRL